MNLSRLSLALTVVVLLAGAAILGIGLHSYLQNGTAEPQTNSPVVTGDRSDDPGDQDSAPTQATPPPIQATPWRVTTVDAQPPPEGGVPQRMIIESLGIDAPVKTFGLDKDRVPGVPLNGDDVSWYDFSAVPGTESNAVFAGHVNWKKAPAVFFRLRDLEVGNRITLTTEEGTELVYVVSENFLLNPGDPASLQVMSPTPTDTITLITCGGTWIPDPSKPLGGDFTNRVIVRATQVSPPSRFPIHWGF